MKMIRIFDEPSNATKNRFENKSKKALYKGIIKMMYTKLDKISKDDLIKLWEIFNIKIK